MNKLNAVFIALFMSACAATPHVSQESRSEAIKSSMLQFNMAEKEAIASCKQAGGDFDELTDGNALPLSMSIICKNADPKRLNGFNAHGKTALENLGVIINNSRNGFVEKPLIQMRESEGQVSWVLSKPAFHQ